MKNNKPKVLILRTAGTNCDRETAYAFELADAEASLVHVKKLMDDKLQLSDYQIMAIPGGFSYGDDISAGILLANELRFKLIDRLNEFIDNNGLIIGICNGFQVLVKSGLLPRFDLKLSRKSTLTTNLRAKFECRWTELEVPENRSVFTEGIKDFLYLPVAHAEGRFIASEAILDRLEANGQIVFRYVSENYPDSPNGSERQIAGICDSTGRILGMMPHPERYLSRYNHPRWSRESELPEEGDGFSIFRNAVKYALRNGTNIEA